ncbi:hypothetical protein [Halocynthiibacter sp.]
MLEFLNATHGLPISVPVGIWFWWKIMGAPNTPTKEGLTDG